MNKKLTGLLIVLSAAFMLPVISLARVKPTAPVVISNTFKIFTASRAVMDDRLSTAQILFTACTPNGPETDCAIPIVWLDYNVELIITARSCKVKKGLAASTNCNDATYKYSDLKTDIDVDANGYDKGMDAAFTAGWGP